MLGVLLKKNYIVLSFFLLIVFELAVCRKCTAVNFDPFVSETDTESSNSAKIGQDDGPVIPQIEFTDSEISMAFKIISDSAGWSIFPTSEVSRTKISLWAKDTTAKDLLDTIVNMAGFVYHREDSIITVMTYEEYKQFYGLSKYIAEIKYGNAAAIAGVVQPFLTKLGKCVVHEQTNSIVLYETNANLQSLITIIKKLDIPFDGTVIEVLNIQYADAEVLAYTLQEAFSSRESSKESTNVKQAYTKQDEPKTSIKRSKSSDSNTTLTAPTTVGVYAVGRSNQLIVKGATQDVERLKRLVEKLDVFVDSTTRNYHFTYIDASEIHRSLQQALDLTHRFNSRRTSESGKSEDTGTPFVMTLIEKTNSIVVSGSPSIHRIMTSIVENADVPLSYDAGSIRIYKLENADVEEVATIIRKLIEEKDEPDQDNPSAVLQIQDSGDIVGEAGEAALAQTGEFIKVKPKVSVSKAANSVIILATTRQHHQLEKLIVELDRRRAQVLIEAFIVEVITTDDLEFGVEIDHFASNMLAFTSFGLSLIDPSIGNREIIASPGGTAAILRPQQFSAVIKMLKSDSNAKITSTPQILVNDNATGFINSVDEEPITQINAGETVATTSFAGFVEAGTQFQITPHISENGYLSVKYQITLNSFGRKTADSSVPPPRNTSNIKSEATVPDGFTIVVGGLQNVDESKTVEKVPLLGDIPLIGQAFRNSIVRKKYKTTYLFITPSIMKKTDFDDIKEISQKTLIEINRKDGTNSKIKPDK